MGIIAMTADELTLRPYQEQAIRHILAHPRCALWAGMGLGKTVATLTALDALRMAGAGPALVLAPLRVARHVWPEEATRWRHLADLRVVSITGDLNERRKALAAPADVHVINYENIEWLVESLRGEWPYETIVADESTRLKGFRLRQGTKRARNLAKHCWLSARFIELTGTPAPNGLIDLWGQAWFLDRGERLGASFSAFTSRWFRNVSRGPFPVIEPLPQALAEIQTALGDLCLTIDARDHFGLREPVHIEVLVDMPTTAAKQYRQLQRQMYLEIGDATIVANNLPARTMSCLQLANGAIYTDQDNKKWAEVHGAKLDALSEIEADAGGAPVLVAYNFRSDLARLQMAFPQARALDARAETIGEWNAGQIPILLAHPASAGHGLNLQDGGNIIVFFGHWWDLEQRQQIIERIGPVRQIQSGHDRPVYIYDIVARGTIDELIIRRHKTKQEVQDILLSAMRETAA